MSWCIMLNVASGVSAIYKDAAFGADEGHCFGHLRRIVLPIEWHASGETEHYSWRHAGELRAPWRDVSRA